MEKDMVSISREDFTSLLETRKEVLGKMEAINRTMKTVNLLVEDLAKLEIQLYHLLDKFE